VVARTLFGSVYPQQSLLLVLLDLWETDFPVFTARSDLSSMPHPGSYVTLTVFNVLGQQVGKLVNGEKVTLV
jgi:hypothetical protein